MASDPSPIADNEVVYDEQIHPLMAQILDVCKAHQIPMVASFEYAPDNLCTSFVLPEGSIEKLEQARRIVTTPRNPIMAFTITREQADA
jgi:hypothetical protein